MSNTDIIIADEQMLAAGGGAYNQIFRPAYGQDFFWRRFAGGSIY